MTFVKKFIILSTILLSLSACVETVVVGSVATGTIVMRDKSFSDTKKDTIIETTIGFKFLANGLKNPGNSVEVTVNEGRVLLTGIIRDAAREKKAVDIAWAVEDVKEVINEIQILDGEKLRPRSFTRAAQDTLLTLQIDTKLLFKKDAHLYNYEIDTVNGVVYLIGVARNERELEKVLDAVARVRGVKKVVNHIILIDDQRRVG